MRSIFLSSVALFSVAVVAACGGSSVSDGAPGTSSDQKLQTKKDGSATGDGASCSWANTSTLDTVATRAPDAPAPTYALGDEFKSIDGCNECACTGKGIMCTVRACETPQAPGGGTVCTADAKKCEDGTYVSRTGPSCEFAPCVGSTEPIACPALARICGDGSTAKSGPSCELTCPEDRPVPCTDDARKCPDGSFVGRSGPKCEFVCPK